MVPITDDDITQGWCVVLVSSNALADATFTMPPHATVWEDARDFGAGWGSWKIPFGGWRFTYGDVGWTNGFAWVEGYFRARFNSRANEIRLLSDRLALCPVANWSRYNLAASRAWSVTNDVDGLVVTFENAAIADDPTKIASVQMELFPRTGEIALRYDLMVRSRLFGARESDCDFRKIPLREWMRSDTICVGNSRRFVWATGWAFRSRREPKFSGCVSGRSS